MNKTSTRWRSEYEKRGALWIHDGNPKRPHALLTSGKHSDGFFNSVLVTEDPWLLNEAAEDLTELLLDEGMRAQLLEIDRVVAPAMGAVTLGFTLASHLGYTRGRAILFAYTEKVGVGEKKWMVFNKSDIRPRETVLLVEDVITTGGSTELSAHSVSEAGGRTLPFVAALVNRSGSLQIDGRHVVALVDRELTNWEPEECPLCKDGSEAIRPKEGENWARLTARH